ncbi:hypothetical protein MC885_011380 [Smutsia gigantea]|nr:hypothetical protein MC885_011380 [Smutsia gigantea]
MGKVLKQMLAVTDQSLEEAETRKHSLNCHRMKAALFSVLCEIKEKTGRPERTHFQCGSRARQPCTVGPDSALTRSLAVLPITSPDSALTRSLAVLPITSPDSALTRSLAVLPITSPDSALTRSLAVLPITSPDSALTRSLAVLPITSLRQQLLVQRVHFCLACAPLSGVSHARTPQFVTRTAVASVCSALTPSKQLDIGTQPGCREDHSDLTPGLGPAALVLAQVAALARSRLSYALLSVRGIQEEGPPNAQLLRLDNMLLGRGVSKLEKRGRGGPGAASTATPGGCPNDSSLEHSNYRAKLSQIQQLYCSELEKYEQTCREFTTRIISLLQEQSRARPVPPKEREHTVGVIWDKSSPFQAQLKQSICEAVMTCAHSSGSGHKWQNFSKQAIEVLNEYFYSHLSNPYPSEEAEVELARKSGITVSQVTGRFCHIPLDLAGVGFSPVSTWLGNKRIRYEKNTGKCHEEAAVDTPRPTVDTIDVRGPGSPAGAAH